MKKISLIFFIVVFAFAFSLPAFAAVKSVKVSGDVTVRHLFRSGYDLNTQNDTVTYNGGFFGTQTAGATPNQRHNDDYNWFMQQVRLRVDADLTDNISGKVELLNQRDWDGPNVGTQGSRLATDGAGTGISYASANTTAPSVANDAFDVSLSKAAIEIKEFLYDPVTVSVGRQTFQMGDGFVIGDTYVGQPDPQNSIAADEFTLNNAFDSILISLDLNPWHVEMFAAKISEDSIAADDDEDVYALNVGRSFDAYAAEFEVYTVFSRSLPNRDGVTTLLLDSTDIYDFGFRGSIRPIETLRLNGEFVFQLGKEGGSGTAFSTNPLGTADFTQNGNVKQGIAAYAHDVRAEYTIMQIPWPTTVGLEYVFYSGEDAAEEGRSSNYHMLYRGKFHSAIREFHGSFYMPILPVTGGTFNQHQFILDMAFHPFNNPDLVFFMRYLSFWFHHNPIEGIDPVSGNSGGRSNHIGDELDTTLHWDYTEDLSFDLIYAFFVPGGYFDNGTGISAFDRTGATHSNDVAQEFVTSVTLNFG